MKRQKLLTFFINCLLCVSRPLCAETITYDFSSPDYWVTELNGNTNPIKGTAFKKIYYKGNNHCFEGANDVYFYDLGGLMLKPEASLKLPFNDDWTINKVTIHSHSKASTSVKVNIFKSTDPTDYVSNSLTWESQDQDYVYEIFSSYRKSSLYIMTANSNNARIASVSIEYTSASASFVAAPTFNPDSQTFSTESLDVTITAAEGCEVYYTIDGTTPSYTNAEEYIGTKGNNVTISASDSPITLKAIAVNPNTNKCSNVSSATYTYSSTTEEEPETPGNEPDSPEEEPDTPIINNGSKESPYTVAEVKALDKYPKGVWVKGTIYGILQGHIDKVATSEFTHSENILIGDATAYIPIKLTDSNLRKFVNLKDHPYLKGKEILIYGNLDTYYNVRSVINPSKYEISYDVAINSYGCTSLFLDIPVMLPEGSTAYYCTTTDTIATLHDIGSIIPDSTGVIIFSTANTTCTLTYTTSTNNEEVCTQNQLFGFTKDSIIAADGNSYYALNAVDGKLGFHIPQTATGEASSSGFTAKANKAYLKVSGGTKIRMFAIPRKNEETDIVTTRHIVDDAIYDLQGRRVSYPTSGIYIQGGKKIIIR